MAEASTVQSRFDVLARLDENYLFLLQFADEGIRKLKEEPKKVLAKKWLVKLGSMSSSAADDKLNRNVYLSELITSMQEGKLSEPFNAQPPQEALPKQNFEKARAAVQIESPKWIDQLMKDKEQEVYVGGKNFETYLSTKMFEGGRGACAYLAVSCENEGDSSAWVQLQSNKKREQNIEDLYEKEVKEFVS